MQNSEYYHCQHNFQYKLQHMRKQLYELMNLQSIQGRYDDNDGGIRRTLALIPSIPIIAQRIHYAA